ncbi:MAG TPA: hypothetical protein VFV11_10215, partial [Solimonas sp.]|nr:hypothetical protein [Solimonas sp.]
MTRQTWIDRARSPRTALWGLASVVALVLAGLATAQPAPATGTLSPASPQLAFSGGPYPIPNQSDAGGGGLTTQCFPSQLLVCDDYALRVELPADYATTHPNA